MELLVCVGCEWTYVTAEFPLSSIKSIRRTSQFDSSFSSAQQETPFFHNFHKRRQFDSPWKGIIAAGLRCENFVALYRQRGIPCLLPNQTMNHHHHHSHNHHDSLSDRPSGKRAWESSSQETPSQWIPSHPQQHPSQNHHFAPVVAESFSEDDISGRSAKRIKVHHHPHSVDDSSGLPPQSSSWPASEPPAQVSQRSTPVEGDYHFYQPMNSFLGQLHQQRRKQHQQEQQQEHSSNHYEQHPRQRHSSQPVFSATAVSSSFPPPEHRTSASAHPPYSQQPQQGSASIIPTSAGRTLASMARGASSTMDPPSRQDRPYSVKLFSNSKLA